MAEKRKSAVLESWMEGKGIKLCLPLSKRHLYLIYFTLVFNYY